ncbi:MAG: hypothetical protein H6618_08815 [Deltaproteobacteria bacterium]|nr:hypothetical protein [Deltaproteobacteria bacterium]
MSDKWSELFSPVERTSTPQIEAVANSVHWLVGGISALTAMTLFIISANRSRQGDSVGAILSGIGAFIVALAPYIATHFMIGG